MSVTSLRDRIVSGIRALLRVRPRWGYGALGAGSNVAALVLSAQLAAATPVTVAALGDSLVHGYGLPVEEGFVPQLQGWLDARGVEARVLNAGVSGDTTAGGLARIAWTLTPEVDALIVGLGGNDLLRGIDPAASRANLDGILVAAGESGIPVLLAGFSAPGNYGPDYKAAFDAIYPELAAEHGAILFADFFEGLTRLPDRAGAVRSYMQPDGIHPNAEGVRLLVEAIGPAVVELVERVQRRE